MSDDKVSVVLNREHAVVIRSLLEYEQQNGELGPCRAALCDALREALAPPPVDVDAIHDPDFTGGLDPVAYLDRLRSGDTSDE